MLSEELLQLLRLELKMVLPVPKNNPEIEHLKSLETKNIHALTSTKLTNPPIFSRTGLKLMLKEQDLDPVNGPTPVTPLNMVLRLNKCP